MEIIKKVSNSLHDWVHPDLPEDLSFIKHNKDWLTNTSHEQESYILTDDKEEIDKIIKIEGLKVRS
ncbi:hypothetical protein [Clostridium sp. CF012]|uniref:hypothetical protein n=1 Tax=Clostridium sp. CF012 TaxID=2843319 RepID=UPI001C0BFA84|nr:hypothetical protein [Clostridium sp. CF012]MBU3144945.1 hypothetical protein [Clostridium sp. CF012]